MRADQMSPEELAAIKAVPMFARADVCALTSQGKEYPVLVLRNHDGQPVGILPMHVETAYMLAQLVMDAADFSVQAAYETAEAARHEH